jgi:hypothetical protein
LRARQLLFPGSSAVEQPAVNRLVAGSNPARGAKQHQELSPYCSPEKCTKIRFGLHVGLHFAKFVIGRGMGTYSIAAVCLRGHVATSAIKYHDPGGFCSDCGAPIIKECPSCHAAIRGHYDVPGVIDLRSQYEPPAFCFQCGKPFPWTADKVSAAKELADELEGISTDDRSKLKSAIDDVTSGGPRGELGAVRIKKMVGKAGGAVGNPLWKITVDIASEAAKKIMLGS